MSWINSNATSKQNSKNDLSFYHGFSKTPVEPNTSNGSAVTTLANASTKSGHTVSATEVWASEIPWFGLVPSKAVAVTRLSGITKKNDLVRVNGDKDYIYIGKGDEVFTEATWSTYWSPITLTNGMELENQYGDKVLRYYEKQQMQALEPNNNAGIDSKGFATRLFVDESKNTAVTTVGQGSVISQFVAGTDNIKNGIASSELNPVLYLGDTQKIAGTHYYDYNVSGTILWNANVKSSNPKITCFRYIGKTVTQQVSEISSTVKTHSSEISEIKDKLGLGDTGIEGTPTLGGRVTDNETALRILLGLEDNAKVVATESISNSISAAEGRVKVTTDALAGRIAQLEGITHFSVVVVPEGQTIENVTPLVENTIYLVKDAKAAEGTYIEYIAYKPAGSTTVVTEKIGSTAIDLSGYTTDAEHEALQGRVSTAEGQIATITSTDATTEGSIAKALADAKTYAEGQASAAKSGAETTAANALSAARTEITAEIAQAKSEAIASAEVTINQGTGIVVTGAGKGTTFTIAVSDDIATTASVSALSQVVASNKTELEGKITAAETTASTALETAKTEIKGTTDALDSRLQTAEGKVSTLEGQVATLTTGDNSVAKQIETAANAIKGQSLAQTGTLTDMFSVTTAGSVGTGITSITISDTGLSAAITKAKTDAETTAATALSTARGEITTEISTAVSGLKTELTTGEGSLGAKVAALETATGTTLPAAIEQALTDAKAYSDSLHTTSLDYVVLGDSESLPTASADTLGKIYLVASQNAPTTDGSAISGAYVEYMTRKVSETEYTWEKIGTTAADLNAYAKTSDVVKSINGITDSAAVTINTTPNADLSGLTVTTDKTNNTISVSNGLISDYMLPENIATVNGNIATLTDGSTVQINTEKFDSTISLYLNTNITSWIADLSNLKQGYFSPGGRGGYGTFFGCSNLEKFIGDLSSMTTQDGMFNSCSELTTFIGDLSSLTNGYNMFNGCTNLTTFIGDLSSLTSGVDMFSGCNLDEDSWEIIADTLPTVEGEHLIHMGDYSQDTWTTFKYECSEIIRSKGWICQYEMGGGFD